MTILDINNEVATSSWQPSFTPSRNLHHAVDSILKPHEDYFLPLGSEVRQIILEEVDYAQQNPDYVISVRDLFGFQARLFKHKVKVYEEYTGNKTLEYGLHIDLGYRNRPVVVNGYTPPHHMFVPDLLDQIMPVTMSKDFDIVHWFKMFETIHPLNDLNGRVGGIVMNIYSEVVNGHYLVDEKYYQ